MLSQQHVIIIPVIIYRTESDSGLRLYKLFSKRLDITTNSFSKFRLIFLTSPIGRKSVNTDILK